MLDKSKLHLESKVDIEGNQIHRWVLNGVEIKSTQEHKGLSIADLLEHKKEIKNKLTRSFGMAMKRERAYGDKPEQKKSKPSVVSAKESRKPMLKPFVYEEPTADQLDLTNAPQISLEHLQQALREKGYDANIWHGERLYFNEKDGKKIKGYVAESKSKPGKWGGFDLAENPSPHMAEFRNVEKELQKQKHRSDALDKHVESHGTTEELSFKGDRWTLGEKSGNLRVVHTSGGSFVKKAGKPYKKLSAYGVELLNKAKEHNNPHQVNLAYTTHSLSSDITEDIFKHGGDTYKSIQDFYGNSIDPEISDFVDEKMREAINETVKNGYTKTESIDENKLSKFAEDLKKRITFNIKNNVSHPASYDHALYDELAKAHKIDKENATGHAADRLAFNLSNMNVKSDLGEGKKLKEFWAKHGAKLLHIINRLGSLSEKDSKLEAKKWVSDDKLKHRIYISGPYGDKRQYGYIEHDNGKFRFVPGKDIKQSKDNIQADVDAYNKYIEDGTIPEVAKDHWTSSS